MAAEGTADTELRVSWTLADSETPVDYTRTFKVSVTKLGSANTKAGYPLDPDEVEGTERQKTFDGLAVYMLYEASVRVCHTRGKPDTDTGETEKLCSLPKSTRAMTLTSRKFKLDIAHPSGHLKYSLTGFHSTMPIFLPVKSLPASHSLRRLATLSSSP